MNLGWHKFDIDSKPTQRAVSSFGAYLSVVPPDGEPSPLFHPFDAVVSGNTITLSVPKTKFYGPELERVLEKVNEVNKTSQIYFKTIGVDDSGNQHYDYYPAQDTFTSIPTDGKFFDDNSDVLTADLPHVDLIAMEVLIN